LKTKTLEELERCLQNASIRILLIMGPELYQCDLALDLIKHAVLEDAAMAFDFSEFHAQEDSADRIIEAANTFPMMSQKRLVLVRDANNLPESEMEILLGSLNTLSPRGLLVFYAEEFDRRKKFYRVLQEKYCVAEFPKLKGAAMEQWAGSFVRGQGFRISLSAIKKIVALAGNDLQTLAAELEKIILYAGKEKEIRDSAVDSLIGNTRQQSIFELIDALGRGDRNEALRSLANLLGMGEHPLVVITMMARYCRQVLIAKDCLDRKMPSREIASAAQIPPFKLDEFIREARAADASKIREMHLDLAQIDKKLKSSSADGRLLLERLICALV
jgi:DNA polymerase-3 subunit delta